MHQRPRDATRIQRMAPNPGLPPGLTCSTRDVVEYTRGHALFYWHPAEEMFGHGPNCALGHMLWKLADLLEADSAELQRKASGPIPRQRKAS